MKKIWVSGASGFIGHYVKEELERLGYQVVAFDRTSSDYPVFLGDIKDREAVYSSMFGCDGAINLAGILGTSETVDNPFPSIEVNILGALNFMETCRKLKIRGVQITVGNHFMNNSYAITKSTAERLALMYNKEHKTKIAVVRALNAYGPRQKHKPVRKITPNFVCQALRGEFIKVYGSGNSIMDMIYVGDVARVLVQALINPNTRFDTIYSAGTGRKTTVNQIAEMVCQTVGLTGKELIYHIPMRAGETEDSVVLGDPTTLKDFGITDLRVLEDGLKETVAWYRDNYNWQED